MFHIILYEPEIPPNTGNIIRLSVNTGSFLHVVEPLGFEWDDKKLRRAGLDYREWAEVKVHRNLRACLDAVSPPRVFTLTTKGDCCYADATFAAGDAFLFGPESRGLPLVVRESVPPAQRLFLPMVEDSRSLNLANAVATMVYEAWRQNGFTGMARKTPGLPDTG